jgi:Protein of unknown function (DUF1706)
MLSRPLKPALLDLLNFTQTAQLTLITELNDTEREAPGTSVHWSARDHVAHLTFWKHHLSRHLGALCRSETPPSKGDAQILNAQVFEEQRERLWADILLDAEQAHADLLASVELFSEDDLVRSGWPPPQDGEQGVFSESQPLWGIILGNGFWHLLEHFTQFYLDRNEVLRATQLQQAWADKVMQEDLPSDMQSIGLYTLALFSAMTKQEASAKVALHQAKALNPDPAIESLILYTLASFYTTTNQKAKAETTLRQALALNPDLVEFSKQDPDMMALLGE